MLFYSAVSILFIYVILFVLLKWDKMKIMKCIEFIGKRSNDNNADDVLFYRSAIRWVTKIGTLYYFILECLFYSSAIFICFIGMSLNKNNTDDSHFHLILIR